MGRKLCRIKHSVLAFTCPEGLRQEEVVLRQQGESCSGEKPQPGSGFTDGERQEIGLECPQCSTVWDGETLQGVTQTKAEISVAFNPPEQLPKPNTTAWSGPPRKLHQAKLNSPNHCIASQGICTTRLLQTSPMGWVMENTASYPGARRCCNVFSTASSLLGQKISRHSFHLKQSALC